MFWIQNCFSSLCIYFNNRARGVLLGSRVSMVSQGTLAGWDWRANLVKNLEERKVRKEILDQLGEGELMALSGLKVI